MTHTPLIKPGTSTNCSPNTMENENAVLNLRRQCFSCEWNIGAQGRDSGMKSPYVETKQHRVLGGIHCIGKIGLLLETFQDSQQSRSKHHLYVLRTMCKFLISFSSSFLCCHCYCVSEHNLLYVCSKLIVDTHSMSCNFTTHNTSHTPDTHSTNYHSDSNLRQSYQT